MVMELEAAKERFNEYVRLNHEITNEQRIVIDVNTLRQHNKELVDFILTNPMAAVPEFEAGGLAKVKYGFEGAFGRNFVTPRTVGSQCINKMICVQGIVTAASLIRPKIAKSVHFDTEKKKFFQKEYRDRTMIGNLPPTNTTYPTRYENRLLTSEYGLSEYFDFQTFVLQEMPENSPPGSLPRSIECILSEDLVGQIKPGDRIDVYGIFKAFAPAVMVEFPSQFKTVLIVNNVKSLKQTKISMLPAETFTLQTLADSDMKFKAIAPTIYGHDDIKKALALQIVGGNELLLPNNAKVRGDINILLVGDPSTAKSQLLRFMINFLPHSVATTGRGSSGVGLTAAVVMDKDSGDKRLEAGAMVLADRGICCIDEFDKMSENDRVAIHEVMEQQTVTIAKAGIHTTLNARCSVLAAANPVLGTYSDRLSPQDNVKLPESLMTRFDLIFITRDNKGVDNDERISEHVLRNHRGIEAEESEAVISQQLLLQFMMYAKSLRPTLSREAASVISKFYATLRESKNSKNLVTNITPRLLETMIRLATAHAKLRLSTEVSGEDANEVVKIIRNNLFIKKKAVRSTPRNQSIVPHLEEQENENIGNQQIAVVKIPAKDNENEIEKSSRDEILNCIWEWRDKNPSGEFCDVKELAEASKIPEREIRQVAEQLAAQDIIMFESDRIYFLD